MQTFLVGGAVRDKLLGKPVHDKDYVVIGATEAQMLESGYIKVGKSFPVFLHPETREEYALARKEIKTGQGHKDFFFEFTPDITLQEDSIRRDFTCNALYQDENTGEIIDYHNGKKDIENRILRHVSEHFKEDPLRVLRMCRFAAQLDFDVAKETMMLCQNMVKSGALKHLSKDRIWQEFEKALNSPNFYKCIKTAQECGALQQILPEVEQLFLVPERVDFHPEGNSGEHTLLTLRAANSEDSLVNFAALLHDIGKTKTDPQRWPSHRGHDKLGVDIIKEIGKRLKVPNTYIDFASFTALHHMIYHQRIEDCMLDMADVASYLSRFEHQDYLNRFIKVLTADMHGRAKETSLKEQQEFENFCGYLTQLTKAAAIKKVSNILGFENILQAVKEGSLPPAVLNDAYLKELIAENPYCPQKRSV